MYYPLVTFLWLHWTLKHNIHLCSYLVIFNHCSFSFATFGTFLSSPCQVFMMHTSLSLMILKILFTFLLCLKSHFCQLLCFQVTSTIFSHPGWVLDFRLINVPCFFAFCIIKNDVMYSFSWYFCDPCKFKTYENVLHERKSLGSQVKLLIFSLVAYTTRCLYSWSWIYLKRSLNWILKYEWKTKP